MQSEMCASPSTRSATDLPESSRICGTIRLARLSLSRVGPQDKEALMDVTAFLPAPGGDLRMPLPQPPRPPVPDVRIPRA